MYQFFVNQNAHVYIKIKHETDCLFKVIKIPNEKGANSYKRMQMYRVVRKRECKLKLSICVHMFHCLFHFDCRPNVTF